MAAEAAHEAANPAQPRPRPKSGFYGVFANRKQWQAQIYHGGKRHNLGSFDTKQQATCAYDQAACRVPARPSRAAE